MHPIVIMAYEDVPADVLKAFETAGLQYKVLNTGKSKLVDFLGALADEESKEPKDTAQDDQKQPQGNAEVKPAEVKPPEEVKPAEVKPAEVAEEIIAYIHGEPVKVILSESDQNVLHPAAFIKGQNSSRSMFSLNEQMFYFHSNDNTTSVLIESKNLTDFINVAVSDPKDVPILKLNKETIAKFI